MAIKAFISQFESTPPARVALAVAALLTVYLASRAIYLLVFHPLAGFPGPKIAALSNIWFGAAVFSRYPHLRVLNLHRKYGPVVRIAPNELSFDTVSSRNTIYGHSASRAFLKSDAYAGFINGGEPSLVGVKDPVAHGKKRKFLAHSFSKGALKSHEPTIESYCDLFVQQLATHGTSPSGVNLAQWFHWFTADVVGDLAFGESFGCLKSVNTHPWVAVVGRHTSTIIWLDVLRRFPLLGKLVRPLFMRKEMVEARRRNYAYSKEKVVKRMEIKSDRKDFMSYLLDQPNEDGMLNEQFLTVSASTFVVAGSETTAAALSGTTYWLLRTPRALRKLVNELQTEFKSYEEITPLSVQELAYLDACIEEGLRMYPPAPNGPTRVCPGAVISGFYVPKGTEVSSHPVAMNRNPKHFHDPNKFLPERWLEKTDELVASQPFLIGPRACIGRNLANLEMRLLLAKFMYSMDVMLIDDNLNWDRDAKADTFWENPDLRVKVKRIEYS